MREPGEQDVERDLVGRLLPRRALDQGDHPVDERLARAGGDAHHDLVRQHAGAAGDRRAVATRLPDHRGRLAGDRRLVDAGDALDDLAVARDHLARGHHDTRRRGRARCSGTSSIVPSGRRRWATVSERVLRSVSACALPRPFGDRLGEVREQHREPEEQRHEAGEHVLVRRRRAQVLEEQDRGEHRAHADHEHHRVAHERARVELDEAVADRPADDLRLDELGVPGHRVLLSLSRPSCSTMGPSARTGRKVRAATMKITPITSTTNSGVSVGNVPDRGGHAALADQRPRRAPASG